MEGNGSLEEIFTFGYWLYAVILRSHLLDPMLKVVRHDLVGYNETQKRKQRWKWPRFLHRWPLSVQRQKTGDRRTLRQILSEQRSVIRT